MTDLTYRGLSRAEKETWIDERVRALHARAMGWPVRVALSSVRKGHPTHPAGTRQVHLVCWHEKCGQTVSVLRLGQSTWTTDMSVITTGIAAHIAQCHLEA